jgi:hypothetical protein
VRVRSQLLVLPVHRRPLADYHAGHDAQMHDLAARVERQWQAPFDELPAHLQLHWKDQWYWPPWFFNDAVGFLKIGSVAATALAGDLFLRRGCFPPTAVERFSRGQEKADEIVFFASTAAHGVEAGDPPSWTAAAERVIDEAQRLAREQAEGLAVAVVWRPDYDLSCLDLERAEGQLRRQADSAE